MDGCIADQLSHFWTPTAAADIDKRVVIEDVYLRQNLRDSIFHSETKNNSCFVPLLIFVAAAIALLRLGGRIWWKLFCL